MTKTSLRTTLLLAFLVACEAPAPRTSTFDRLPRPTDPGMVEEVERLGGSARRRRLDQMHKTAPDVDWKRIEQENGEAEMARRNALALSQGLVAPPPTRWGEIGSKNQAGRIHVVARAEGAPSTAPIYAGADLGGVWRGNPDGTGWTPLGDNLYGGAQHLVVLPGETVGAPDVIIAGQDGGRVRTSRDQGLTWETPSGLPTLSSCRGLDALTTPSRRILVYGQFNSGGTKPGVFSSDDYGRTYQNRWTGGTNSTGWMWVPRKGAQSATHAYLVHGNALWASTDAGTTWAARGTIATGIQRAVLTGSEAGAPTLYAAVQISNTWRIHRSLDAGVTWTQTFTGADMWDGTLCASTIDANLVMFGGLETWRSTNGGAAFTKINNWGDYYGNPLQRLHADTPGIHAWPDPSGTSERWWISTDGGSYVSSNGGATVTNLSMSGLGVSQYYSTLTSRSNPDLILAGAQDQGYQRGTYVTPTGNGPSTNFTQLISGDYGHLTSSTGNHDLVYCTYPGFVLIQQNQSSPQLFDADFPVGSNHDWLPMVVADPLNANSFFFCGEKLYRYDRSGNNWTPSVHTTYDFLASGGSFLTAVAFAPSNAQRMYAVTDNGRLFVSTNHGTSWTQSAATGPSPHYFYGSALAVHPTNQLEAVVGGSGYSAVGVRKTLDGGVTWSAMTTGLPATHVYDLAYPEDGSSDVYAATEAGAYRWNSLSATWENIMELGTPITRYWSVEAVPSRGVMRFGSYARGIWDYSLIPPGPVAAWVPFGENLGGANVMTLSSQTPPSVGATTVLDVTHPDFGDKSGWIYLSDFGGSVPFLGGTLLAEPIANLFRVRIGFSGTGSARYVVPNEPALIGTSRYFQAIVVDPQQPQGYALSNGLEAVFGP